MSCGVGTNMSQPVRRRTLTQTTEAGAGEELITRAHPQMGLFVTVEGIDPSVDTFEITLECSPTGEYWARFDSPPVDDLFFIDQDDLNETHDPNVYAAYVSQHNQVVELVRPNILEHSGGFEVTVDVFLSGWTQRGSSFDYLKEHRV